MQRADKNSDKYDDDHLQPNRWRYACADAASDGKEEDDVSHIALTITRNHTARWQLSSISNCKVPVASVQTRYAI